MADRTQMNSHQVEEGGAFALDFDKLEKVIDCGQALVPVAVQDADSKEVLVVAYVNRSALDYTLENEVATFWSTSRNELWIKGATSGDYLDLGATSGDYLDLVEVRVNCEQNSLLYLVRPRGEGACHTKGEDGKARAGCYYRRLADGQLDWVE